MAGKRPVADIVSLRDIQGMAVRTSWLSAVGRRNYFIFAGLLVAVCAILPGFVFTGGPAGWLLLFMARTRDIGRSVWAWPSLAIVAVEMAGKPIIQYAIHHFSRSAVGYGVIGMLVVHLFFVLLLGLQRHRRGPDQVAEAAAHFS